jgi:hypothetical protein
MRLQIVFNFGGYYSELDKYVIVYIYPKYYDIYFNDVFYYIDSNIKLIEVRHLNSKKYSREYKDFILKYYT